MIPLLTIEGPTASGKTKLALKLAQALGAQIISADSRQVYRYLDIGTAKPSKAELQAVPHHLIDILEPDESYNVGRFCSEAGRISENLHQAGILSIVCGGTGLYVSGLLRGIFSALEIPGVIRSGLRERLANEGLSVLYEELRQRDPGFAAQVSNKDTQRILRGLEVYQSTGTPITEHWRRQTHEQRFQVFRLLLDPPRELLYDRINQRIGAMLEAGWLEELRGLLKRGFDSACPGLNSLGYKELLPHVTAGKSLDECAGLAAQHTRNYAKRQCTWYRKHKFDLTLTSSECNISSVAGIIQARLQ